MGRGGDARNTNHFVSHYNSFVLLSHNTVSPSHSSCQYVVSFSLLPLPLSKTRETCTVANPIATEANRTRTERFVRFGRNERVSRLANLQPREIFSPRSSVQAIVIFLPRNLLSLAVSIACDARILLSYIFSLFFFSIYENRVGSFNRGPVPWLLARPLAGFE